MEEDDITLSLDTQKILNEFLREKAQREHDERENGRGAAFEEDWQLSQFWYSISTKKIIGRVVQKLTQDHCGNSFKIGLLSCPSLYVTLKEIFDNVNIFEYDKRFSAYGEDFVFYDFNEADAKGYLHEHRSSFDLIIADPPFLSEECIDKISKIIRNIQKPCAKIIFCSGEVVEPWLTKCLELKKCQFRPEHQRNLGNEFVSYANFNLDAIVEQ